MLGDGLRRIGVPADALTVFGLLASVATAFLIGSGHLGWAVAGVIVAGVSDLLDGVIARGSGEASPRGAFFDSVSDRVSDALLLGGAAWYLENNYGGPIAPPPLALLGPPLLVSFLPAEAGTVGVAARGGRAGGAGRSDALGR